MMARVLLRALLGSEPTGQERKFVKRPPIPTSGTRDRAKHALDDRLPQRQPFSHEGRPASRQFAAGHVVRHVCIAAPKNASLAPLRAG